MVTSSKMMSSNITMATWNKPWPPEIDWMDPYLNFSSLPKETIEKLIVGDKMKTKIVYQENRKWGRRVDYYFTAEHSDAYYREHYASRNETLVLCYPYFPVRLDLYRSYVAANQQILYCFIYKQGMFKEWLREEQGDWSYIWSTFGGLHLITALSVVGLITFTGLQGD